MKNEEEIIRETELGEETHSGRRELYLYCLTAAPPTPYDTRIYITVILVFCLIGKEHDQVANTIEKSLYKFFPKKMIIREAKKKFQFSFGCVMVVLTF